MSLLFPFLRPVCRGVLLILSRNVFTKWNHLAAMSKQKNLCLHSKSSVSWKFASSKNIFYFNLLKIKSCFDRKMLLIFLLPLHNKLELTGLKSVFFGLANMPLRNCLSCEKPFKDSNFSFFLPKKLLLSLSSKSKSKSLALKGVSYVKPIMFLSF